MESHFLGFLKTAPFGMETRTRAKFVLRSILMTMQIERIQPAVDYIEDPSYCQTDADCYCLSGSGVPFIGCSNLLYAPLNWSGYYAGDELWVCIQPVC